MLAWEPVVEARALHARGWTISAIARHLQINRRTVRRYLSGEVEVGERRPAGPDEFERFAGYAANAYSMIRTCGPRRCTTSCSSWATRGRTRR